MILMSKEMALNAINEEGGEVQKNLGALGQAVYSILTEKSEVFSDKNVDAEFWGWVKAVNDWLKAIKAQNPGLPEPPQLPTPTELKGKIQ